jgi:hypothetical protein
MDIQSIIADLQEERDRIQQAIDALAGTTGSTSNGVRRGRKPGQWHMPADARRRIGLAMKKAWAKRKGKKVASTPKKARNSGISAAGRKRISEMMKQRWAAKKKMEAA